MSQSNWGKPTGAAQYTIRILNSNKKQKGFGLHTQSVQIASLHSVEWKYYYELTNEQQPRPGCGKARAELLTTCRGGTITCDDSSGREMLSVLVRLPLDSERLSSVNSSIKNFLIFRTLRLSISLTTALVRVIKSRIISYDLSAYIVINVCCKSMKYRNNT